MRSGRLCLFSMASALALPALTMAADDPAGLAPELTPPVQIMAGDAPIDVDIGHAAPFVYDFDGDGVRDLLVGQFGEGALRIYRNVGTNDEPKFDQFEWFMAGGAKGTVPFG